MKVLTVAQAAEFLQVSVDTLYPMIQKGSIPAGKVKGQWRLIQEDLVEWLRGQYEAQKEASRCAREQARPSEASLSAEYEKALAPRTKKAPRISGPK